MMRARLTSRPGPPLMGGFTPPGDKSITHRAWLLGLLNAGTLHVRHANPGADCRATRACAAALGARIDGDSISGGRLGEPADVLECGNSGTTLRLLAGVLAAQPFTSVLSGDASLRRRPLRRIIEPLERMGAQLLSRHDGLAPLAIRGARLRGIEHVSPVASAQVLSCVLLAGLGAQGRTAVELPGPARDHTERMLEACGVPLDITACPGGGRRVAVEGPRELAVGERTLAVAGDFSAAAFFLAAAAARDGAAVTARGVNLNPTRTGLLDVLERMGAEIARTHERVEAGEPVGDVTVTGRGRLEAVDVPPEWMPRWIDEVPAWAAAAAQARGRSRITGAAELRVKESDRIAGLAHNLRALGIAARELDDGLEIEGGAPSGGHVEARGDHRIAMLFAVLGGAARAPVVVDDARAIETSYPGFAADLEQLGGVVEIESLEEPA